MMKKNNERNFGKVAVLMGGQFTEREISLLSGRNVLAALVRQGIDAKAIDVGDDLALRLTQGRFDRAFIALHGTGGEDGVIQGLLESLSMPYTGSGVAASALAMDKLRCKLVWQAKGLPTPAFHLLNEDTHYQTVIDDLGLPLFVKPVQAGSSLGINKVCCVTEMQAAYHEAKKYDPFVLAERCIHGAEYTVGIVGQDALPTILIKTPRQFYDYDAKYFEKTTEYICPSGLSAEQEQSLQQIAWAAYQAIGCRHWGRVDFMMDENGDFYLLELNTIPGLTDKSLVPLAARTIGMDFDQLMQRILSCTF